MKTKSINVKQSEQHRMEGERTKGKDKGLEGRVSEAGKGRCGASRWRRGAIYTAGVRVMASDPPRVAAAANGGAAARGRRAPPWHQSGAAELSNHRKAAVMEYRRPIVAVAPSPAHGRCCHGLHIPGLPPAAHRRPAAVEKTLRHRALPQSDNPSRRSCSTMCNSAIKRPTSRQMEVHPAATECCNSG